jgi:hypothetical protein
MPEIQSRNHTADRERRSSTPITSATVRPDREAARLASSGGKLREFVPSQQPRTTSAPEDAGTLGMGSRSFRFGSPAFVAPYRGLSDEGGTPAGVAALRAVLGT